MRVTVLLDASADLFIGSAEDARIKMESSIEKARKDTWKPAIGERLN